MHLLERILKHLGFGTTYWLGTRIRHYVDYLGSMTDNTPPSNGSHKPAHITLEIVRENSFYWYINLNTVESY